MSMLHYLRHVVRPPLAGRLTESSNSYGGAVAAFIFITLSLGELLAVLTRMQALSERSQRALVALRNDRGALSKCESHRSTRHLREYCPTLAVALCLTLLIGHHTDPRTPVVFRLTTIAPHRLLHPLPCGLPPELHS